MTDDFDDLDDFGADPDFGEVDVPSDPSDDVARLVRDEEEGPEPQYANVTEFVEGFLRNVVERKLSQATGKGLRWDPRWRRHPEVVLRLDALWKAFEGAVASEEPSAMSKWWIYDFDPHMRVLLDGETGPMSHDHDSDIYPPLPIAESDDPRPWGPPDAMATGAGA